MMGYGRGPSPDECEITLFGPGYGEAIAVHLCDGQWMLVDSCINPRSKSPAALEYLAQIQADPSNVKIILASHWHDDHVRGLASLAESCPQAELMLASTFNNKEAAAFLQTFSGELTQGLSKGTKELYQAVKNRKAILVQQRANIFESIYGERTIRVTALSPTCKAMSQFVANMAQYLPRKKGGSPITHIPELKPNVESVVVHIDLGDDAILLGSDLENTGGGWPEVLNDCWSASRRRAAVYKVAHHGSQTGDTPTIWTVLLQGNPVACLTPFNNGSVHLPTDGDKIRIKHHADRCYLTSLASKKPKMEREELKRLGDICNSVRLVDNGFGAVRIRKPLGGRSWAIECFGDAQAINPR